MTASPGNPSARIGVPGEFDSMHKCWPLLDGLGNVDEYLCDDGPSGALLRFFDPQSRRWSMHWVSSRDGVMQPPAQGVFRNGVGEFYGETQFAGHPILVRYLCDKTETQSPSWEQAFSDDDRQERGNQLDKVLLPRRPSSHLPVIFMAESALSH